MSATELIKEVAALPQREKALFEQLFHALENGSLVRLNMPEPPKRKTRAEVRKAMADSKLKFDMSWDELRELTREP
jgi:hypothetical protein